MMSAVYRRLWVASWLCAGCLLDTQGSGATDGSEAGPTGAGSSSSSGSSSDTTSTSTTGEDTTGDPGDPGVPELVIDEAPTFDFGSVNLGMTVSDGITLRNVGNAPATGILTNVALPFEFRGGLFPGASGTCADQLDPDDSCTLDIDATAVDLGPLTAPLRVLYDGADALVMVDLEMVGVGTTENLVSNGGAEDFGMPPPGWVAEMGAGWDASEGTDVDAYAGDGRFNAGDTDDESILRLSQSIDLSKYASLIDAGGVQIAFAGWARSLEGLDEHRFVLEFETTAGSNLDLFTTSWNTSATWQQFVDTREASSGTRVLKLALDCRLVAGTTCDGYFDEVSLLLTYSP
jgi:hypothetical protein